MRRLPDCAHHPPCETVRECFWHNRFDKALEELLPVKRKLGQMTRLHNWFLAREEYIEALLREMDPFDDLDGDQLPTPKVMFNVINLWGDLAVWLFSNRKP